MASSVSGAKSNGDVLAGKYRLVRTLGTGGMGIVFEAQHELTAKRVAIKLLRPELSVRPDHVQRMLREAQASARIRHPNVVDVLDVGSDGDTFFLVMELLEGETLGARLKRGPLSVSEALALLMPAMRGVAAGHALGIVHRDIKPENIFLARLRDQAQLQPKVLDFGISKLLAGDDLSLTESGTTLGTPLYMSYEQLTGLRDVDAQSDVYAFGVILYEALTGNTPYRAETLGSLAVQVATTTPRRPSELVAGLPSGIDHIVLHALARDRSARFLSLDLMLNALAPFAHAAQGHGYEARPLADTATLPTVSVSALRQKMGAIPQQPARRSRVRRSLLVLGAVAAFAGGAALLHGTREAEPGPQPVGPALAPSADVKMAVDAPPQAPLPSGMSAVDAAVVSAAPQVPAAAPTKRASRSSRREQRESAAPLAAPVVEPAAQPSSQPTTSGASERSNHRAGKPRLDEF